MSSDGDAPRAEVDGPFAPGSVSIGVYVYESADQSAEHTVSTLLDLAQLAEQLGFDGVTVSEHHRGRVGYMPNPLQLSGWYLDVLDRAWAAPCPMVLPLRNAAVVAEEAAWLNARFPGRVGLTVAAGADPEDFAGLDALFDQRVGDFETGLGRLSELLSGREDSPLVEDPALMACRSRPVPVAVAAMTRTGVRRAARVGAGVAFGRIAWQRSVGTEPEDGLRTLLGEYDRHGGDGPRIFTSQVFLGRAPDALNEGLAVRDVRGPAASGLVSAGSQQITVGSEADAVVADLTDAIDAGMTSINVRVPYHGVSVDVARAQMHLMADQVLPAIRSEFAQRFSTMPSS